MEFYKYNALGNHFILIEGQFSDCAIEIDQVCSATHVGADGVIFINPADKVDCRCQIFNRDGSEALVCGNALRTMAYHLHHVLNIAKDRYRIASGSTVYDVGLDTNGYYATFAQPSRLIVTDKLALMAAPNYHVIRYVNKVDIARLYEDAHPYKALFNSHELMPIKDNLYAFISYERGVGLTDSCVSGAVCAYAFLNSIVHITSPVTLKTLGGDLHLSLTGDCITASGYVRLIYKGELYEDFDSKET